jgi:hypothetical protein
MHPSNNELVVQWSKTLATSLIEVTVRRQRCRSIVKRSCDSMYSYVSSTRDVRSNRTEFIHLFCSHLSHSPYAQTLTRPRIIKQALSPTSQLPQPFSVLYQPEFGPPSFILRLCADDSFHVPGREPSKPWSIRAGICEG